jgi:sugar lactone lactonase YvrE
LNDASGSLTIGVSGSYGFGPPQLAIDHSGNVWSGVVAGYQVLEIPAGYNGTVNPAPAEDPANTPSPIGDPEGTAFDGSNRLWVANAGNSGYDISPNLSLLDTTMSSPSVSVDYEDTDFANGSPSVAVDSAGNVWVLLGNNTVKEYVGIATPVVTPLSLGVKGNKLGAKP